MHDPIAVKYAPDCDLQLNRSLIACHAVSELIQTKISRSWVSGEWLTLIGSPKLNANESLINFPPTFLTSVSSCVIFLIRKQSWREFKVVDKLFDHDFRQISTYEAQFMVRS